MNSKMIRLTSETVLSKGRTPLEMERTQDFELMESVRGVSGPSVLIHEDESFVEPGRLAASFDGKSPLRKSTSSISPARSGQNENF